MSALIERTNGKHNIAFRGARADIWHHLGTGMEAGQSIEQWAKAAGLDWSAIPVPALADLSGKEWEHLSPVARAGIVDGQRHIMRSDNGHALGYVSDGYHPVQPAAVLDWFQQYISADEHFELDVAGALKQGEIIWATATYNGGMEVAGEKHVARLLMTTTFDGTGATINQGTMTRVVCNNTLKASLADKRAIVKTRHNTKFNAEKVGRELGDIAQGFAEFKVMGDAMAQTHMAKDVVSKYFKALLGIPFDAKKDDISTRKMNQYGELVTAYATTVREGTEPETAWTALNAVTRYVDHDRATKRGAGTETESRFLSAQFGSGAQLKAHAVELLTTNDEFKELMARSFSPPSRHPDADLMSALKVPFKPRS